jgi:sugar phosphate isomerase/epimerase
MGGGISRRTWMTASAGLGVASAGVADEASGPQGASKPRKFEVGTVTYNIARDWNIDQIIERGEMLGLKAVELRTTHAHGVEPNISAEKRREVRNRFAKSKVRLFSLGSTCEYHSADPAVVARQIETTKQFLRLAADVGAVGVKVRPNGLVKDRGVPADVTLRQIGQSLATCGEEAQKLGVQIFLEVHGSQTSHPPNVKKILDACGHPAVGITWNSNPTDVKDGSVREYFELLRPSIRCVHLHDLYSGYPFKELFSLLRETDYSGYTLAEIGPSHDPVRVLRYFIQLWDEWSRPVG